MYSGADPAQVPLPKLGIWALGNGRFRLNFQKFLEFTFKAVVFNHCSEGRMRLPSIFCAALSSFSIKLLIFCVADFVVL